MNPASSWDKPATDSELSAFYGAPVTAYEINQAVVSHMRAYDETDLHDAIYDHKDELLAALLIGDEAAAGKLLVASYKKTVADRASRRLFGRGDKVQTSEVVL
jgi:hypothetical protein